jgi:hypothetical protein
MTKKKNIQASNQNVINSQDGIMNSMNDFKNDGNITNNTLNDFPERKNPGMQPGAADTRTKR